MLPWKLRKCQILPVNQNRLSVYFSLAKFQLVSCNLSLDMIWQMTYTHKQPKLCSATLSDYADLSQGKISRFLRTRVSVVTSALWDITWDSVEEIAKIGPFHYNRFSSMIISQHGIAFTRNGIVTHASASFQRFLASHADVLRGSSRVNP